MLGESRRRWRDTLEVAQQRLTNASSGRFIADGARRIHSGPPPRVEQNVAETHV